MRGGMMMAAARRRIPTGDPYFASVSSLLHFDGNLTDQKGRTWTAEGGISANGSAKYGSNALACGSGKLLRSDENAALTLSGDFTVEFWINPANIAVDNQTLMSTRAWGAGLGWAIFFSHASAADGIFGLYVENYSTGTPLVASTTALANGVYKHVALTRSGNTWSWWIHGVLAGQNASTPPYQINLPLVSIGDAVNGSANAYNINFLGELDDVRITKGVARYTANFTPPISSFPDS